MKQTALTIRPIGDRILIRYLPDEKMVGLIHLPEIAHEKPQRAEIMALGSGNKYDRSAKAHEFDVKVGDKILIARYTGAELQYEGVTYNIIREDDIVGRIE